MSESKKRLSARPKWRNVRYMPSQRIWENGRSYVTAMTNSSGSIKSHRTLMIMSAQKITVANMPVPEA